MTTILKKSYFNIFLILFITIGFYLSVNTGITHDEFHDFLVSESNKNLFLNKILGKNFDTSYVV